MMQVAPHRDRTGATDTHLSTSTQRLAVGGHADRQDHELLHGQVVAGVAAAVDDVEGGHRQRLQRSTELVGGEQLAAAV